jgi:aspartyl-tRNA(Asn)/glutamyl-tRNA(Gln) amidotransferase subunit C
MILTRTEIEHVARLARLELTAGEMDVFTPQMAAILSYVDKLNELETGSVVPTSHAVPMENAFRDDITAASLGSTAVLANAPDQVAGFFRVPKVIE